MGGELDFIALPANYCLVPSPSTLTRQDALRHLRGLLGFLAAQLKFHCHSIHRCDINPLQQAVHGLT